MSSSEAKNSASVKDEVTASRVAAAGILATKPVEAKPRISLGPLDDLGNKKVLVQGEKSSKPEDPESSTIAQTASVKQEIVGGQTEGGCGLQLSTGKMNVELSLGPKESVSSPALEHQQKEANFPKSDKLESLLSLALHEEKLVFRDKKDIATDSSNPVSANRSNWDLNTTMDVWEGSTCSDAFAHGLVNTGGFNKSDSCRDDKSLLTMDSTAHLGFNKGKHVVDGPTSSSSKSSPQQYKMDDSLGLRLAMPFTDTSRERSSLSDNLDLASVNPNLSSKQVKLPIVNVSRAVKSEPIDDNSKRDCSIGSCSSTNMGPSKLSSVKREHANNHNLGTILQSSISLEKLDDRRSIKSEVVQERKEEACKLKDAATLPVARIMQHQDSCASSTAIPVSLLPQSTSLARLPTCSELTTNGDFSNQSEQIINGKESQSNDMIDEPTTIREREDSNQSRPSKLGISSVVDHDKFELARIDEHPVEPCQIDDAGENGEIDMDISNETLEEDSSGSDNECEQNRPVDTVCEKEDEEYEDGEVREHVQHSAEGDPIVEGKKNDNLELVRFDSHNLQPADPVFKGEDVVEENLDETHCDQIRNHVGVCYEPISEDNSLQESFEVSEVVADDKRATSVTPNRQLDKSVEDVHESQVSCDIPTDGRHRIDVEIGGVATAKVVRENCSGEGDFTSSKVEACLNGHDAAKDANNAGNKSRIINLSRPSVVEAPFKTKSISNRLLTSRSGKERYSDFDGEMQPRGNR